MLNCSVDGVRHKQKEYTGIGGCVAIRARCPSNKPVVSLTERNKKLDDEQRIFKKTVDRLKKFDIVSMQHKTSEEKAIKATIDRRVKNELAQRERDLDRKRMKLRYLLAAESREYEKMMKDKVETIEQRKERYRQYAFDMQQEAEEARKKFVEEKEMQRIVNGSDAIRMAIWKQRRLDVAKDQLAQMDMKRAYDREKKMEDAYFDRLWLLDAEKKAEKEKIRCERLHSKYSDNLYVLEQQRSAMEARKQEDIKQITEERQLMDNLFKKLAAEDEERENRKKQQQEKEALLYERHLKEYNERVKKDRVLQAQEKAFWADAIIGEAEEDQQDRARQKKASLEEMHRYNKYLEECKKEKDDLEKQKEEVYMKSALQSEKEALRKERRGHQIRAKLNKDASETQKQQMLEHRQKALEEKEQVRREKEEITQQIEKIKKEDFEAEERRYCAIQRYRKLLRQQISKKEEELEKERNEDERMRFVSEEFTRDRDAYVKDIEDRGKMDYHQHPWRFRYRQKDLNVPAWFPPSEKKDVAKN